MRRIPTTLLLLALVVLAGCLPSFHPVYTDGDLVTDGRLAGAWKHEDGTTLTFEVDGSGYSLAMRESGEGAQTATFDAHLARVGDILLLDFIPTPADDDKPDLFSGHLVPMHGFFRVVAVEPTGVQLAVPDYEWLAKHLEKHPRALSHQERENEGTILTASTSELQAFIRRNAAQLFDETETFARVP